MYRISFNKILMYERIYHAKWSIHPLRPINSNPHPADPELSVTLIAKPYTDATGRDDYYRNASKIIKSYGQ